MRVIKPTVLNTADLISTTATDAHAAWTAGSYALGAKVTYSDGYYYECIEPVGTSAVPGASFDWSQIGPSNRFAMFDDFISTQSTATTALTVVVEPGICNSLALFNLTGSALAITMKDAPGGNVVYSYTKSLDGTEIIDWYQYYFEPFVQLTSEILTNIPPYGSGQITVQVSGIGTVGCGHCVFGTVYDIGGTEFGATVSITDYSKKTTDSLGAVTLGQRDFADRISARALFKNSALNKVKQTLTSLRAVPCAWLGVDSVGFEVLSTYGYYRDFTIEVAYPNQSYCSIEIEGLT
jgi:hypothetical protein